MKHQHTHEHAYEHAYEHADISPVTRVHTLSDTTPGAPESRAAVTRVRTPYHELGESGEPHVPHWAGQRSVYRSGGRTLYLVETDRIDSAQRDLDALAQRGWDVRIDPVGDRAASIALSRTAA